MYGDMFETPKKFRAWPAYELGRTLFTHALRDTNFRLPPGKENVRIEIVSLGFEGAEFPHEDRWLTYRKKSKEAFPTSANYRDFILFFGTCMHEIADHLCIDGQGIEFALKRIDEEGMEIEWSTNRKARSDEFRAELFYQLKYEGPQDYDPEDLIPNIYRVFVRVTRINTKETVVKELIRLSRRGELKNLFNELVMVDNTLKFVPDRNLFELQEHKDQYPEPVRLTPLFKS